MTSKKLSVALGAAITGLSLMMTGALAQTSTGTGTGTDSGSAKAPDAAAKPAAAKPAEAKAPDVSLDTVLATVNGKPLTLGQVLTLRRELPAQYQKLPDEVLYKGLVDQMTDQMLLADAARKAGLADDTNVKLSELIQTRAILSNAYLLKETKAQVTPDAIQALYKTKYLDAKPQVEVKAAHILVKTKAEAEKIKKELDKGANFADLAKKYGTDGTKDRGGELGWFVKSDMVPAFADAAFAMKPGTISDPVQTSFGWHIIKLEGKRDRKPPTLDEVRGQLIKELTQKAQMDIVTKLRSEGDVQMSKETFPPKIIREDKLLQGAGG